MKKKPTEAELEILSLLWTNGPSTVRTIHESLSKNRDVFYTTTLKTMQLMAEKDLLTRDTKQRSHIYHANIQQKQVAKNMLDKLVNTVFSGSTSQLIVSALGQKKPSKEELEEIKVLIDKLNDDGDSK